MGEVSLEDQPSYQKTPFGKEMLKHFQFDPSWHNLNHGSFGSFPRAIRDKQREYQDICESRPDPFIRYEYPRLLDQSRAAAAKLLNAPLEAIVFVPNATTGINIVLRNMEWSSDGKDEILYFTTIYGACGKTIEYVCEASRNLVNAREINFQYPIEDADLIPLFKEAIAASRAAGKTPRLATFDIVSSLPGIRMPFEALTQICRQEGILSLIDGAHSIGHLPLDLSFLSPDFFVSNAHKWLYVPRGCAVLYVPVENQHLMRSSLPTSHGFVPRSGGPGKVHLPPSSKSEFVNNFEFTGTIDNTNYICVEEAIKWREEVCGGEKAIIEYCTHLAKEGGKTVAKILGTEILDNKTETMSNCCLVNVLLPLQSSPEKIVGTNTIKEEYAVAATQWMQETLIEEYKTFLAIFPYEGKYYARLSGQIYLEMKNFEWAGEILKKLCERAGNDEFIKVGKEADDKGETEGDNLEKDGTGANA